MIVEVAVKYEGEAYVAEGGECGTTLELAKIYNTLGSFYQEQVRGWKWGECVCVGGGDMFCILLPVLNFGVLEYALVYQTDLIIRV